MHLFKNLAPGLAVAVLATASGSAWAEIVIEGKVTAGGEAAAQAEVTLISIPTAEERGKLYLEGSDSPEPAALATTDGRGYFRLAAPEIGMWAVRVEAPAHAPAEHLVQPLLDGLELPGLDLDAGADLGVEVRGPEGEPVDARVVAFRFNDAARFFGGRRGPDRRGDAWSLPVFVGRTGENGRLEITVDEDGPYLVGVVASGLLPAEREVSEAGSVRFELRPGRERTVRAVDGRGKAVAGVLVYKADAVLPLAATGDDGRAAVLQGDEPVRLRFAGPGGRHGDVTLGVLDPEVDPEEVTVTLAEAPRITGRVIDRETRRPIAGALVWPSGSSGDFALTDGNGAYAMAAKDERNAVRAAAEGYATGSASLRERASGLKAPEAPTLALTPAGAVGGRVVDEDGNALAEVEVVATAKIDMTPAQIFRRRGGRPAPKTARSDRRGAFRVAGLAAGDSYQLRFRLDGYAEEQQEVENLKAFEERADLQVVLDRGRRGAGLVVDEEKSPVPGATVRLKPREESERGRFGRVMVRFGDEAEEGAPGWLTDARGRYEIPDLAAGKYDLEVEAIGFARAAVPGVEVPEDVSEVDLGTVVLAPGVEIRGRVTDADGRPLAAAEVRVGQARAGMPAAFLGIMLRGERPRGRSDVNGRFTVDDLRNGESVNVLVSREGFVDATVASVLAPTIQPLEVVLKPASRVLGKVVDEDGYAVEDAQVRVDAEGRRGLGRRAQSRPDGTFEIEDVAPGRVTVSAQAPGYQEYSLSGLEVPDGADLEGVALTLAPGAVIEGTVFAPDGRPVIDAGVRTVEPGASSPFGIGGLVVTDGDGRFWLDGLPLGRRTVVAEHEVYQRVARDVDVENGVNRIDLVFEGGVDVTGQVIGPQGEPIADARVTLAGAGRFSFLSNTQEATSQADGSFRVIGVQPGQYTAQASKQGFAQASAADPITVGQSPVSGVEVRLTTGATLTGAILGLGVDELAGLRIFAASGREFRAGEVDFDGRYRVLNLGAGDWRVSANLSDSGRRASGRVTVAEDDLEVSLDLEFGTGYVLTGTVLVGSRPMAGAMVSASGRSGSSARATTSQDGTFRLEDLEEGTYTLSIFGASFTGLRHREEVEITGDDDVLIELVTARVAGLITNAYDHAPVVGARVRLEPVEDDEEGAMFMVIGGRGNETDSRGYFSLVEVPEGSYKLIAQRSGFAPAEELVDVDGGALPELELEMTPTEGLYFETALGVGGAPTRVNAAVLRTPGSTDVVISGYGIETGENGRVRLTEVPPGSFELLVSAPGTVTVAVPAVSPGQLGRVVLPIGGVLKISVPDLEGQPAKVRLVGPSGQPYRDISFGGRIVTEPPVGRPIEGLAPGAWSFTVTADDGRTWSGEARVGPSQIVEVVLN